MAHLRLKLVSQNNGQHQKNFEFSSQGGSIGRSDLCEWTLLDEERFISKKHAEIFFQNNQFYVSDNSTNGVFVNNTSNLLGNGNSHVLKLGELLIIGVYQIIVDDISLNNSTSQLESNNDLLDLVLGGENTGKVNNDFDPLFYNKDSVVKGNSQGLGLNEILDNPVSSHEPESSFSSSDFQIPVESEDIFSEEPFDFPNNEKSNDANQYEQSSSEGIPTDWELSGIMPAISNEYLDIETKAEDKNAVEHFLSDDGKDFLPQKPFPVEEVEETPDLPASSVVESLNPLNKEEPPEQVGISNKEEPDVFFETLYKNLYLPGEYKNSVNKEVFAKEVAEALLSTTKGLMSLLNGRTVFKQESRLSLTSIQPRSNNPLKFSIDPGDSLEMLLLKKKTGYMNVHDAFEEAICDIQSHQMAFLAGLQATLNGILNELEPEKIEAEAALLGKNFMGINSTSKAWKLYAEKQNELSTNVRQNLNDVLSKYFADTYQAQIDNIKKNLI